MPDLRFLIEWMRCGGKGAEWICCGPVREHTGFVVVGSKQHRTPAMISCNRTRPQEVHRPRVIGHMMGPGKGPLGDYDDSFWERWYLPPGVHPMDVQALVDEENEFSEKLHAEGAAEFAKKRRAMKKRASKRKN